MLFSDVVPSSHAKSFSGAGEGGKSTLLKQMRLAYGAQFSLDERIESSHIVASNVLNAFDMILQEFHENGSSFCNPDSQVI